LFLNVATPLALHDPVLRAVDGDTVETSMVGDRGWDTTGRQVTAPDNPMTGPFFVEGVEPGASLAVHLDRLAPT